jgi:NAD(P)-dependent dehydrogenase (short-subunit alcohol dehydrogenase family)
LHEGDIVSGRLEGKVAVITGGASGIGAGTVRRFVEEGARVVISDLQTDLGSDLLRELGSDVLFARTDVTVEDDVAAAVDVAITAWGQLDCMFNNAGILGVIGSIVDTPADAWERTIGVLLDGVFYGMKHAARVMRPQRSGVILSTSSTAGLGGGLGPHAYTAAKHAVIGLTKSVASELSQYGIRVNAISPGSIVTPLTASAATGDHNAIEAVTTHIGSKSPLGFAGLPEDIANAALFLASDEARNITGHCLPVDAGQTSILGPGRFHGAPSAEIHEAGRRTA